ncbi:ABC transporter substrate-binding protein [Fodinibius sp.]|uniref:ABC transporter substrate-binding protein n=1 Tax=Fodinibius sp. TaxID=1872440 RepID=UPI002ACEE12C|nr:ABC transporter substrate-binding protein [Fodinibius sp.]MDZ7659785.1 ABC transporter substrate-binding protein [Fodinibius sp.]
MGWLTSCLLIGGCTSEKNVDPESHSKNLEQVQFADSVHAEFAEGFQITYHENYKLLEILKPFQDQVDTLRYSLVPRGIADKVEVENTTEIPIPINSLLATSTTHIGLVQMLDATDILIGMVGADYVYSKDVRKRLEQEKMVSLPHGELNKEKILSMNPDLLMISGGESSQFDNVKILMDSDIDVMINSEWLETTPLGKAEWVKVLAALLNKEQLANEKFNAVANEYNRLKSKVSEVNDKPLVINNMPYKGAWFVSGGESFTVQFLRDAGADYPWFDSDETGGLRKSFEVIYEIGLEADIWINPGAANSKEDILAKDSRFKDFKPFETGEIYNNNKRTSPAGGNDFWESGVVHPEIILADLIKIFHPQKLPNHRLFYYQKID